MATSGRLITNYVGGGYSFAVDWEVTSQDIAANTSEVECTVKLISNGTSYTINSSAAKDLKLTINGKSYSTTVNVSLNGGKTKTLFTKTLTVPHNADGSKSCAISAVLDIEVTLSGTYYATFSVSGTAALNVIPRQSEITSVTSNIPVDGTNKMIVVINRKSSAYTHDVRIKFGAYETTLTGIATRAEYVIPTSWLNAIPNSETGTGTVFVTTKNGSTKIGSTVSKGYTLAVPSSVKPTFSSIGIERINGDVPAGWGIYVQGKSKCKATITGAAGIYGSTIKKYEVQIGDTKGTAANLTADLPNSGTVTIKGTVTDSRGRTFSRTSTITVAAYKTPILESIQLFRANANGVEDDDGTYIGGVIDFTYSAIGQNAANASIEYRLANTDQWTYAGAISDNVPFTLGGGNLNVDNAYEIRLGVADALDWIGKIEYIPTGFTLMDLRKGGKGVAFGKVAESDIFDVALDARFREPIVFDYAESIATTELVSNVAGGITISSCYAAKWGRFCTVYITAKTTNAISAGDIANKTICTMKETLRPIQYVPFTSGAAGGVVSGQINPNGNVVLASVAQSIGANGEFSLGGSFICTDTSGRI